METSWVIIIEFLCGAKIITYKKIFINVFFDEFRNVISIMTLINYIKTLKINHDYINHDESLSLTKSYLSYNDYKKHKRIF